MCGEEIAMMPSTSRRLCSYISSLTFYQSGWFVLYFGGDVVRLQCERTDIRRLAVDRLLPIW